MNLMLLARDLFGLRNQALDAGRTLIVEALGFPVSLGVGYLLFMILLSSIFMGELVK